MDQKESNQLIAKVSEIKVPEEDLANKAFDDFILRLTEEGNLKDGVLNLKGLDESERAEFLKLAQRFDMKLFDALIKCH